MGAIAKHFPFRAIRAGAVVLAVLAAPCAFAAQIFVAGSDPKADDKNSGTEALPFQTIQAALDKAQAGDTIWVKQGIYEEELLPKSSGNMETPITLSAWKDDRVRIGSVLHGAPAADQWKPIEKSRSYGVKLPGGQPKDLTVVLDGKPIVTEPKDSPPPDDKARWATYRASDRTLMLNLGGEGPAGHTIQLSRDMVCFYQQPKFGYWAFKKLEFAWAHWACTWTATATWSRTATFTTCITAPSAFAVGYARYGGAISTARAAPSIPAETPTSWRTAWSSSAARTGRTSSPTGAGTSRANPSAASSPRAGG